MSLARHGIDVIAIDRCASGTRSLPPPVDDQQGTGGSMVLISSMHGLCGRGGEQPADYLLKMVKVEPVASKKSMPLVQIVALTGDPSYCLVPG